MKPSERQDRVIELMERGAYGEALELCRGIEPDKRRWIYRHQLLSQLLTDDLAGARQSVAELQSELGDEREFAALALLVSGLGDEAGCRVALEQLEAKQLAWKGKRGVGWARFAIAVLAKERDPELATRALTSALDGIDDARRLGIDALLDGAVCAPVLAQRDALTAARPDDIAELEARADVGSVELPTKLKPDKAPGRLRVKGKATPLIHEGDELSCIRLARGANRDKLYVAASYGGLAIVDIASPKKPSVEHVISFEGSDCRAVTVIDDVVYCADYNDGLQLVDVGGKAPTRLGLFPAPYGGQFSWMAQVGEHHLAVMEPSALTIFDVEDPRKPRHRWTRHCRGGDRSGWCHGLATDGALMVTAQSKHGLVVYELDAAHGPRPLASLALQLEGKHGSIEPFANGVTLSGKRAFVPCNQGLWLVDLKDPAAPATLAFFPEVGACRDDSPVLVVGERAYVCNENTMHVIALDGDAPRWLGKHGMGRSFEWLFDAQLEGELMLGAADSAGLYIGSAKPGVG
jgi:hypothetical protein